MAGGLDVAEEGDRQEGDAQRQDAGDEGVNLETGREGIASGGDQFPANGQR